METAKRILSKEKIERQLAGQSSLTPFMNIKDGYNSRKVTFDTHDNLHDKIDRLTSMISKLTAQDDNQNKQFKPKIYQCKQRGQTRNFYDQNNYNPKITRIDMGLIVEIGEHHIEIEVKMDKTIEEDCIMLIITKMTLDVTILPKHKITEQNYRGGY